MRRLAGQHNVRREPAVLEVSLASDEHRIFAFAGFGSWQAFPCPHEIVWLLLILMEHDQGIAAWHIGAASRFVIWPQAMRMQLLLHKTVLAKFIHALLWADGCC